MIRINLLKPEKKELKEAPAAGAAAPAALEVTEKKKASPLPLLVILLVAVVIVALIFTQTRAIAREQALLNQAEAEKKELSYVTQKLEELAQKKELFEKRIGLIQQLKAKQKNAVLIMNDLSQKIPEWVWMTEVNFSGQALKIKGKALNNNLLSDFMFNLKESPYFTNVNLISSSQRSLKGNNYIEFSLTAIYVLPLLSTAKPEDKPSEVTK